ncbi:hypothetical protein GGR53DRAFT_87706 [Hypoxylon sp. FL1150]|nr:hypothetical protein GGR53DRAFT_87706 [Hypoxylon sp. FL1150]
MMAEQSGEKRLRESYPSLDNNAWSLSVVAIILVGLRIWCRCNGNRRLWWDDYLLVISLALIISCAAVFTGLMNQTYNPTDPMLLSKPGTILYLSIFHVLSALSQGFSKTSIVLTFFRLTSGIWKISLCVSIFVFDAILFSHTISAWIRDCDADGDQAFRLPSPCIPAEEAWFLKCLIPALSFFFDVFLIVLPWKIVKSLRLQKHEKTLLAVSMSLGVVAGTAALVRFVLWIRLEDQPDDVQLRYQLDLVLWNYIEPAVAIIAATLPMLRTLAADLRHWSKGGVINRILHSQRRKSLRTPDVESLEADRIPCQEIPQEGRAEFCDSTPEAPDLGPLPSALSSFHWDRTVNRVGT